MSRKTMDCRDYPSERNCSLTITGTEEEVLLAATEHAIAAHGHKDSPELREQLKTSLKDEQGAGGEELVRELYEAINRQDPDAFDRIVSEQVEYVEFGLSETLKGREAFKDCFRNWWTAFPKGTGEIRNLVTTADQVVVESLGRGVQSGPFETFNGTIEPSDRRLEIRFCSVFVVKDGRIVSGRTYSDAFEIFAAAAALEERKAA